MVWAASEGSVTHSLAPVRPAASGVGQRELMRMVLFACPTRTSRATKTPGLFTRFLKLSSGSEAAVKTCSTTQAKSAVGP